MFRKKDKNDDNLVKFFVFVSLFNFLIIFFFLSLSPKRGLNYQDYPEYLLADNQASSLESEESRDSFITRNPKARDLITEPVINANDPSLGPLSAKVNLVLFSDINCSFSKRQYNTIREVLKKYPDDIRFIWKDYPSLDPGSKSFKTSVASRCAFKQDKFFQYREAMLENPEDILENDYLDIAKDLGLDKGDFKKCFKNEEVKEELEDNIYEANSLEIPGVPYLFINKREILGEIEQKELEQIINFELATTED